MGIEGRAHDVGWQNGVKMMPHEEQQRMVFEAIAMVVHIVAIEEESCVPCFRHILVPKRFVCWGISSYFKHLL